MAVPGLKECKEFVIFRAFTENERFVDACRALTAFDKSHPDRKILRGSEDKKIMQQCFTECRQAMSAAFSFGEKPDFDNLEHLNRFKNAFNQQLPKLCQKRYEDFTSVSRGKVGMGVIFAEHISYIERAELSFYKSLIREEKREGEKREYEQARVDSYRPLEHGYGNGKVFSGKPTYKTPKEALLERMIAEKRGKGIA